MCPDLPSCPTLSGQEQFGFVVVITDEIAEGEGLSGFFGKCLQSFRDLDTQSAQILPDVIENMFAGNAVQLN